MSYIDRFRDYATLVVKQPDKLIFDIRDFLFNNWILIICIYFYYRLCVNFLGQALLLLQDGANGVPQFYDWIFALTDSAITSLSFWLPLLFSLVVFSGVYYLKSGSFNPKESDRNTQYLSVVALTPFVLYFVLQLVYLNQTDKSWYFGLEYMDENSGFQLSNDWPWETELQNSRWTFYAVGISNAVRVVLISILFCTIIGTFVGVARLSNNLLLSKLAEAYVEFFRNMPLVVQLFFWLTILGDILPKHDEMWVLWDWVFVSNRTIQFPRIIVDVCFFGSSCDPFRNLFSLIIAFLIPFVLLHIVTRRLDRDGVDDSDEGLRQRMYLWVGTLLLLSLLLKWVVEIEQPVLVKRIPDAYASWYFEGGEEISSAFIAMMIGLTIYTSVQVAEIVRGSIQSLPRGQVEAAISLGLSPFQRLRLIILPQALRSMIPPLNNQYLNCWKNSSLAMIISFSDHFSITTTIVNNAGQAVPAFIMLLLTYQIGSMTISAIMNYMNSRVTSVKI
uniref:Amino acid ABC transporter permease (AapQ, bztB) n=1 Tax=uncultured marine group II/III euryarchaeote AD1000_65_H04 TaxID=1457796 RepID=A0A075FW00_9EURY|nr:amino acid ABC transporter permease (aapQ, bztB) [uncultured marine group II/III euryarchaeote AD1000_65_H04]